MKDRKPKYSTSTVLSSMFLGFAIGFLTCNRLYMKWDKTEFERQVKSDFYYEEIK